MPSTPQLMNLFLIFARILAVLLTAPVFSSRTIPTFSKIGFAACLAVIFAATRPPANLQPPAMGITNLTEWLPFLLLVAQEVLIGLLVGFVSNLVFVTVGMAASMMGLQIGFRAANLFDPMTTTPTSSLEQFYTLLALALFLSINGHHWLIKAVARTFDVAPPGTFVMDGVTVARLITFTSEALLAAVRIALPIVGALLLTDLGLGLVARAVPQIQVFFLGLPIKMGLGFLALALTLALTLPLVKDLLSDITTDVLLIVSG